MRLRPTVLETRVVQALLAGDEEPFPALREQWASAWITKRAHTRWSLIADIEVARRTAPVRPTRFDLSDVHLEFESIAGGGYGAVFVDGGRLVQLEIANWQGPWRRGAQLRSILYTRTVLPVHDDGDAQFIPIAERDWDGVHETLKEAASWPASPDEGSSLTGA